MSGEVYIVESRQTAGLRDHKVRAVFGSYDEARDWIESKGYAVKIERPWNKWEDGADVALFESIDTSPEYSGTQFVVSGWIVHGRVRT